MEPESGVRHPALITPTIMELPIEILEKILAHLSTKKLLEARFVSKLFKNAATPICRRSYVQLNLRRLVAHDILHIKNLYTTFNDLNNVPWSSVKLIQLKNRNLRTGHMEYSFTPVQIQQFIRIFGVLIRQIQIGGDNDQNILEILRGIPNVDTVVGIREDDEKNELPQLVMPIETQVQLPKLTLLTFNINRLSNDIKFIRILINSRGNCLRELRFIFHRLDTSTEEDVNVLAQVIAPFPVSLQFSHVANSDHTLFAFSGKDLKITEMDIKLAPPEDWTNNFEFVTFCKRLGSFLTNISEHIHKFTLHKILHRLHSTPASQLKMPALPALKSLDMYLPQLAPKIGFWNNHEMIFPYLTPFEQNQFPNLEVVKVKNWIGESGGFTWNARFDTVRELRVAHILKPNTRDVKKIPVRKWHSLFPNLKLFEGLASLDDFKFIMSDMTGLEHLDLTLVLESDITKGDINAILTGIPDANSVYNRSIEYKTEKEVDDFVSEEKRVWFGRCSLLTMTKLKTLVLRGQPRNPFLTVRDSGACLSLLKIQPLQYFGLGNSVISDEVEAKLRSYHGRFEKVIGEGQGVSDAQGGSDYSG